MPRLFHFAVRNDSSQESLQFKGQGERMEEAFKDGLKLMGETFRPKNDGKQRPSLKCNVTTAAGQIVLKTFAEWESGGAKTEEEFVD